MAKFNPSTVAAVVVAVLAVGAVGSIGVVAVQDARQVAAQRSGSAAYTPPPIASPRPSPLPVIAVIGDSAASQSVSGVGASERWPARVAAARQVRVAVFANGSAGYTVPGSDGRTFLDQTSRIPRDAALVMFVGGGADAGAQPLDLIRAASSAISDAKKRAPTASVVVVGPIVAAGATSSELENIDNTLQSAASIGEATFADPLGEQWLGGSTPVTGSKLTAADERRIAARLETITQQVLTGNG